MDSFVYCNTVQRLDSCVEETRRNQLNEKCDNETKSMEAAIADLFEAYYNKVVRYIYIRISDQPEAEDLAGEVFLKALKSMGSYRGSAEQLRFWIFKIARNIVIDHYRKMSKRRTVNLEDVEIADGSNVEEMAERRLQVGELTKAMDQLTQAQREVIGLRFFAGLSSAETAQVLGKSSGAVREMQCDAIQRLRKLM
jgi:RNA polymerase sigma-70 factor (ECF subfamily)